MNTKKPLTIGLLIRDLEYSYQQKIWNTVVDTAKAKNANILIFVGKSLNSPYPYEREHNSVYNLINSKMLDGLILTSGSLSSYLTNDEYKAFYNQFKPLPMVSISIPEDDIPSVTLENKEGMRQLIRHLIAVHKRKRLAFIKGPETNPDASARFDVYLEVLAEFNIPFDPNLVETGDFIDVSGRKAALSLLQKNKDGFDALIAANDNMAIEAMKVLRENGVLVPEDVSVGGFDDIPEASFILPYLTTVFQPVEEQAQIATILLLDMIAGKDVPKTVLLKSKMKVRQSCGCLMKQKEVLTLSSYFQSVHYETIEEFLNEQSVIFPEIVHSLLEEYHIVNDSIVKTATILIQSFFEDILGEEEKLFPKIMTDIMLDRSYKEYETKFLQDLLKQFKLLIEETTRIQPKQTEIMNQMQQKGNIILDEKLLTLYQYQNFNTNLKMTQLGKIIESILRNLNEERLKTILESELSSLQIPSFAISIYIDTEYKFDNSIQLPGKFSKLLAGFKDNRALELSEEKYFYPSSQLVPDDFFQKDQRYAYAILPLVSRNKHFGFGLFEFGYRNPVIYKTLQDQLSNALETVKLIKEIIARNETFERELIMARRVQRQILPSVSPRTNIAFYYEPMEAVGGDFFYFIEFPGTRNIGMFICDVSGHGLPAAIITSMIKTLILQFNHNDFADPARFMLYLNESLVKESFDQYLTAFYGVLNMETYELTYSHAAHPFPFIIHDDKVVPLSTRYESFPIGIYQNDEIKEKLYKNYTTTLSHGTKMLLYTDGLIDLIHHYTHNKGADEEGLEEDWLKKILLRYRKENPEAFIEKVKEDLKEYKKDGKFKDDICMICVEI